MVGREVSRVQWGAQGHDWIVKQSSSGTSFGRSFVLDHCMSSPANTTEPVSYLDLRVPDCSA